MMNFQAWKKMILTNIMPVFYPFEIQTHQAPQNDCLNLSFVKDIYIDAKKMTTNSQTMAIFGT